MTYNYEKNAEIMLYKLVNFLLKNIKILLDGVPLIGRENGNIDLSQINLSNIEKIEIIDYADLRRKIGIDGLFGFYGYYELAGFGKVKLMAKRKQQMVLILSSKLEPIVVSVDDVGDLQSLG